MMKQRGFAIFSLVVAACFFLASLDVAAAFNVGKQTHAPPRRSELLRLSMVDKYDKEKELPEKSSTSLKSEEEQPVEKPIAKIRLPNGAQMLVDAILSVYSYVIIAAGTAATAGLVLNFLGFGYQFRDGNLHIDTIQQLRTENQFRREVYNSMKEQQQRDLLEKSTSVSLGDAAAAVTSSRTEKLWE